MRYTCFLLIRDGRGRGDDEEEGSISGEKNFLLVLFFRTVFALDDGINSSARYLRNFSGDEISLGVPSRPVPVCSLVRKLASVTSICERPHGRGEREREKKEKKGERNTSAKEEMKNFLVHARLLRYIAQGRKSVEFYVSPPKRYTSRCFSRNT